MKMRRFRLRRRRMAIAALLPLAVALPATTSADATAGGKGARIDASKHSVPIGRSVTLSGVFPGASRAPIEIRYRAQGARAWHTAAHARTGASGRYRVRVKPRRIASWRAEPADPGAARDAGTAAERVAVRSRTRAKVVNRD